MMQTMFQYPDADPDSIRLVDQDPDPDAGSGSRQADFVSKKEKNEEFSDFHAKKSFFEGLEASWRVYCFMEAREEVFQFKKY